MRSSAFVLILALFQIAVANKICDICGCEDPNACEVGDDARGKTFILPDRNFTSGCKELQRIANQGTTVFSNDYCTNELPYQTRPICKCFIVATLEDLPEVFDPNNRYGNITTPTAPGSGDDDDDDGTGPSSPSLTPPTLGGGTLPCPINEPNCDRTNNGGDTSSALQMVPGMLGTLSLFLGVCALW